MWLLSYCAACSILAASRFSLASRSAPERRLYCPAASRERGNPWAPSLHRSTFSSSEGSLQRLRNAGVHLVNRFMIVRMAKPILAMCTSQSRYLSVSAIRMHLRLTLSDIGLRIVRYRPLLLYIERKAGAHEGLISESISIMTNDNLEGKRGKMSNNVSQLRSKTNLLKWYNSTHF